MRAGVQTKFTRVRPTQIAFGRGLADGHQDGRILGQGHAVIGQRPFVDDPARGGEHTDVMAAVAEIEAEGEAAGRSRGGRGSGNDGRSGFLLFFS